MRIERRATLSGLLARPGMVNAAWCRSRWEALEAISTLNEEAITASGPNGAMNVWFGTDGLWRCEFMRNLQTINTAEFKRVDRARGWIRKWWPCLGKASVT